MKPLKKINNKKKDLTKSEEEDMAREGKCYKHKAGMVVKVVSVEKDGDGPVRTMAKVLESHMVFNKPVEIRREFFRAAQEIPCQ